MYLATPRFLVALLCLNNNILIGFIFPGFYHYFVLWVDVVYYESIMFSVIICGIVLVFNYIFYFNKNRFHFMTASFCLFTIMLCFLRLLKAWLFIVLFMVWVVHYYYCLSSDLHHNQAKYQAFIAKVNIFWIKIVIGLNRFCFY